MAEALIQIVDESDIPIRGASKQEAWEQDLLHRIVIVIIEDKQGRVLLQKRPSTMDLYPNCWDNSASGHVDEGEDYETAAKRELSEELGIKDIKLQEVGTYRTHEAYGQKRLNRIVKVFKAVVDSGMDITPDKREVTEVRWLIQEDVKMLAKANPEQLSDGLQLTVNRHFSL